MSSTPPWEKTAWRMHWKRGEWACLELTELMYMHASCICTIALTLFVYWAINICSPFHQMYSQVKTIIVPFLGVPYKKKRGEGGDARPWAKSGDWALLSGKLRSVLKLLLFVWVIEVILFKLSVAYSDVICGHQKPFLGKQSFLHHHHHHHLYCILKNRAS